MILIIGTVLPILAAIDNDLDDRLRLTQTAVALLVIAGLMLAAEKAFGWSSGWMRYVTTVNNDGKSYASI